GQLTRQLLYQTRAEERAGDRQANAATKLLEQGEAARGRADLPRGDRALHDEREDREHRPDPETGDEHPCPENRERGVRSRVRKRPSGTIGSDARDSTQTKIAATASPRTMRPPTAGSPQLPVCLLVRPTRIGTRAPASTDAPR